MEEERGELIAHSSMESYIVTHHPVWLKRTSEHAKSFFFRPITTQQACRKGFYLQHYSSAADSKSIIKTFIINIVAQIHVFDVLPRYYTPNRTEWGRTDTHHVMISA